jgi:hypothetical protein
MTEVEKKGRISPAVVFSARLRRPVARDRPIPKPGALPTRDLLSAGRSPVGQAPPDLN